MHTPPASRWPGPSQSGKCGKTQPIGVSGLPGKSKLPSRVIGTSRTPRSCPVSQSVDSIREMRASGVGRRPSDLGRATGEKTRKNDKAWGKTATRESTFELRNAPKASSTAKPESPRSEVRSPTPLLRPHLWHRLFHSRSPRDERQANLDQQSTFGPIERGNLPAMKAHGALGDG